MRNLVRFSVPALLIAVGVGGRLAAEAPRVMPAAAEDALPAEIAPKAEKAPAPAAPAAPAAVVVEECPAGSESAPRKFPPTTPLPRPGIPVLLPTGPGYYSLWDQLMGDYREAPPKYGYPRFGINPLPLFDADWSYLDDPNNTDHDYADCLKRIPIGENIKFTTGGELRWRYANEMNSRLTGKDNTYDLFRIRAYGDLTIGDRVRIYAEYLYADSAWGDLPPLKTDIDRNDLLNAFVELRTFDIGDDSVYVRLGRQELCYGSQRLISALDWANTRRTFQGAKAYWHSEHLDLDAFAVRPVVPTPESFDSWDDKQSFIGGWATWKPSKNHFVDGYYLYLDNQNNTPVVLGIPPGAERVHTIGSRYYGEEENGLMLEAEGAVQVGDRQGHSIFAQMGTAGVGWNAKNLCMTPQFWLYYDYASGTSGPTTGSDHTFNELFPFNHYYFGFLDIIGRQNIRDLNAQFTIFPAKWLTTFAQYHVLNLDKAQDALYNAAGTPIRRDPKGRAGTDVGQILDLVANIHLDKHSDIFFTYGHLFSGDFIRNTAPPGTRGREVDYILLQYSYRW